MQANKYLIAETTKEERIGDSMTEKCNQLQKSSIKGADNLNFQLFL